MAISAGPWLFLFDLANEDVRLSTGELDSTAEEIATCLATARMVQGWLGHATLEQTIGTYSHCRIGQGAAAQKALDSIIG